VSYITIAGAGGGGPTTLVVGLTPVTGGTDNQALTVGGGTLSETPIRIILTANTNFYVSTTGNDSNNGLTLGTAWATLQHARDFISTSLDIAAFTITVNIGAGSFAGLGLKDCVGGGTVKFIGAGVASTTILAGPNDGTYNGGEPVSAYVIKHTSDYFDQLTIDTDTSYAAIVIYAPASIGLGTVAVTVRNNLSANIVDIQSDQSELILYGAFLTFNYTPINSAATSSFLVTNVAYVNANATSWTTTGNPSFTAGQAFLDVETGSFWDSSLNANMSTIVATGVFAIGINGALIDTDGVVPSGMTLSIDASSAFDRHFFTQPKSGSPTTSDLVNDKSYAFYKDTTNGPRSLAVNDGGIIYTRQIGNNINFQTGTSYTLALADQEGVVEMNNANPNTLTVPLNATVAFPIGTKISVLQEGAGATTIAAAGGVTVRNVGALAGQYKTALLFKRATDEWIQTNGAF
jgi:hypothetical protein